MNLRTMASIAMRINVHNCTNAFLARQDHKKSVFELQRDEGNKDHTQESLTLERIVAYIKCHGVKSETSKCGGG